MSNDPNQTVSWRGKRTSASSGGNAPGSRHRWLEANAGSDDSRLFYRWARLLFLSVVVCGMVGFLVFVVFQPKTATPIIALAVADYNEILPPNAFAVEDQQLLAKTFGADQEAGKSSRSLRCFSAGSKDYNKETFVAEFRDKLIESKPSRLLERWFGSQCVVIYISAHGAVNHQGEPCLILSDPRSNKMPEEDWSENWLPLATLLDYLKGEDASLDWLRTRQKILILDCNKIHDHAPLGILYNQFADSLPSAQKIAGVPHLHILNSTSGRQTAWSAPEVNGTVFGHFVTRGLAGAADGEGEGKKDKKVSWYELRDYVSKHVAQWTLAQRNAAQLPSWHESETDDFPIAFAAELEDFWPTQLEEFKTKTKRVQGLWQARDELRNERYSQVLQRSPMEWADLNYRLCRLESMLTAGKYYVENRQFDSLYAQVEATINKLNQESTQAVVPLNFPLAGESSRSDDEELKNLRTFLHPPEEPKPEVKQALEARLSKLGYWKLATLAERYAANPSTKGVEDIRTILQLLGKTEAGLPRVEPIEVHFLRMLNAHLDPRQRSTLDVSQAVVARRLAEQAASPEDVRVHWWIDETVNVIDRQRRIAEDELFIGDAVLLSSSKARYNKILNPDEGKNTYQVAIAQAEQLSDQLALRDRAAAELPYWIDYSLARMRQSKAPSSDVLKIVQELARASATLSAELENSLPAKTLPAIGPFSATDRTRFALQQLQEKLDEHLRVIPTIAGANAPRMSQISQLLTCPLISAQSRESIRELYLDGLENDQDGKQSDPLPLDYSYEKLLAGCEVHPLVALLAPQFDQSSGTDVKPIPADLAQDGVNAQTYPIFLEAIQSQENALRRHLQGIGTIVSKVKDLPSERARREQLSQPDRLVRNSAPVLVLRTWSTDDPAVLLHRFDQRHFLYWHANRAVDDFWDSDVAVDSSNIPYFKHAADQFISAATKPPGDSTPRYGQQDLSQKIESRFQAAKTGIKVEPSKQTLVFPFDKTQKTAAQEVDIDPPPAEMPLGRAAYYLVSEEHREKITPAYANDGPADPLFRQPVSILGTKEPIQLSYLLNRQDFPEASRRYDATVLYRGHVWYRSFKVRLQSKGIEIAWAKSIRKPRISTEYQESDKELVSTMFLLDCSSSMNYATAAFDPKNKSMSDDEKIRRYQVYKSDELTGKYTPTNNKLDSVRDISHRSLKAIAANMLDDKAVQFQIGLSAFGHELHRNPGGVQKYVPSEYSQVMGFKPLNLRSLQDFDDAVDDCEAHGLTPLYESIRRSILDFPKDAGRCRLVVLTDGADARFRSNSAVSASDRVKLEEVLKKNPRVHVTVLMLLHNDEKETENLVKLADYDNFDVLLDVEPEDLVERLKDVSTLSHAQFEVFNNNSAVHLTTFPDQRKTTTPEMGATITVESWDFKDQYKLRYLEPKYKDGKSAAGTTKGADHEVTLYGGERLRLKYVANSSPPAWEHMHVNLGEPRALETAIPQFDYLRDTFQILPADPQITGSQRTLQFVFENSNPKKFTPRPQFIWTEITPDPIGNSQPYLFYDLDWVPDKPVPVLKAEVPDWPGAAKKAKVTMFIGMEGRPSAIVMEGVATDRKKLPGLPEVEWSIKINSEAERTQFVVTEEHAPGTQLHPCAIFADPEPTEVYHQYFNDDDGTSVRHVFEYNGPQRTSQFKVIPRQSLSQANCQEVQMTVKLEK